MKETLGETIEKDPGSGPNRGTCRHVPEGVVGLEIPDLVEIDRTRAEERIELTSGAPQITGIQSDEKAGEHCAPLVVGAGIHVGQKYRAGRAGAFKDVGGPKGRVDAVLQILWRVRDLPLDLAVVRRRHHKFTLPSLHTTPARH